LFFHSIEVFLRWKGLPQVKLEGGVHPGVLQESQELQFESLNLAVQGSLLFLQLLLWLLRSTCGRPSPLGCNFDISREYEKKEMLQKK
jgi:hypothetical protein